MATDKAMATDFQAARKLDTIRDMRIGVVGTGNMGKALGGLFAKHGHEVIIGSREPAKAAAVARELDGNIRGSSIREVAEAGEAVLLAVHFAAARSAIEAAGPMPGKLLLDCVNPLTPDFMGLTVGYTTSAAEQIAAWAPQAHVVKLFNHNFAPALSEPVRGTERAVAFYCGDNEAAKGRAAALAAELGFDPVDVGALECARFLEPFAELVIRLAYKQGLGPRIATALLRR